MKGLSSFRRAIKRLLPMVVMAAALDSKNALIVWVFGTITLLIIWNDELDNDL